jgi:hypothetical protein
MSIEEARLLTEAGKVVANNGTVPKFSGVAFVVSFWVRELMYPKPVADGTLREIVYNHVITQENIKQVEEFVENRGYNRPNFSITPEIIYQDTISRGFEEAPVKNPPRQLQQDLDPNGQTYSAKVLETLSKRQFLGYITPLVDLSKWKYHTLFPTQESIADWYLAWEQNNNSFLNELLNAEGELKEGIVKNTFLKITLPRGKESAMVVGEDNLMTLCNFYESRNQDLHNFDFYHRLRGYYPEFSQAIAQPQNNSVGQLNSFVYNPLYKIRKNTDRIYEVLGRKFWEDKRTGLQVQLDAIDKDNPEYAPSLFPAEEFLNKNLINQWTDFNDDRSPDYNADKYYQTCYNWLDLIKHLLTVQHYRLGLNDYPVYVPKSLKNMPKDPQEIEELQALLNNVANSNNKGDYDAMVESDVFKKYMEPLPHLTRYQSWQSKTLDELLGSFPIDIHIEDSDLIRVGDQSVDISLPNIAESLAEIIGLLLGSKSLIEANLNASLRGLGEIFSNRLTSLKI